MNSISSKHPISTTGGVRKSYDISFNNPNTITPTNAFSTNLQGVAPHTTGYYTDASKVPQTSRSKPTASFGTSLKSPEDHQIINMGMLSNRSHRTQANDETEFEEEGESNGLNSLIESNTQKTKQPVSASQNFSDGEQSRDVLLLRCRDAIEELHIEIEDERNQKLQLQKELQELQQFTAELKI